MYRLFAFAVFAHHFASLLHVCEHSAHADVLVVLPDDVRCDYRLAKVRDAGALQVRRLHDLVDVGEFLLHHLLVLLRLYEHHVAPEVRGGVRLLAQFREALDPFLRMLEVVQPVAGAVREDGKVRVASVRPVLGLDDDVVEVQQIPDVCVREVEGSPVVFQAHVGVVPELVEVFEDVLVTAHLVVVEVVRVVLGVEDGLVWRREVERVVPASYDYNHAFSYWLKSNHTPPQRGGC